MMTIDKKITLGLIGKTLLITAAVLLVATVIFVTRDTTVDFSGTVTQITKSENGDITYTISAANGELSVLADSKTQYTLYPDQDILADYVSVDDVITGDYRLFNKERAKNICVTPHSGAIQNKQYAYDSIVYPAGSELSNSYKTKHIAISGDQNNMVYYEYSGLYAMYDNNTSLNFKKEELTQENVGKYINDDAFKEDLIINNLNTFIAEGTYIFEQRNGDVYYAQRGLPGGEIETVYKLKYVGDIISTDNETLKNDISAFYSSVCSGTDKTPDLKTALSDKLRPYLENRFFYQRDAVKWLGQNIKGVDVSIDHAVKMGDIVFYDAVAIFDYHVNGNKTSCSDRIHILIDEKENTIIDWSVRYGGYDFESGHSDFFFADKSTWLQNITVKNVKFEAPVPQNTNVIPATDKTYVCYNKDTISTEIKGLEFDVEYDPKIKKYVIGGGMGQLNAIEKIEICNRYVKLYFTQGSSLNGWMSWGAITVNKNSKEFKELSSGGKAQYGTHTIYHFDDKRMSFSEKNGQHILTYTFDEPIPEFIKSLDISAGKVD